MLIHVTWELTENSYLPLHFIRGLLFKGDFVFNETLESFPQDLEEALCGSTRLCFLLGYTK